MAKAPEGMDILGIGYLLLSRSGLGVKFFLTTILPYGILFRVLGVSVVTFGPLARCYCSGLPGVCCPVSSYSQE